MNKKSLIKNLILVASLLILVFIIVFSISDITSIWEVIKHANLNYILICIGLILIYLFLIPFSLHILVRKKNKEISFIDSMSICTSEFFFNGITPFSAGGQPYQVYAFNEKKVSLSESTSNLMINFIIYQIIINLISVGSMFIYFTEIKNSIEGFWILIIVGFTINIIVLILLFLIALSKKTRSIIDKFLRLLCKIKFLKKFIEPKIEGFNTYVVEVQDAFKEISRNKLTITIVSILKIIAMFVFYSIPFFAMKAIGVDLAINQIFFVIAMTSFALTIVIWLPTPGSSGGAEFAFTTLFMILPNVDKNIALSGMLIWRFFTYYFVMLYGFIGYLIFEKRHKNENRNI